MLSLIISGSKLLWVCGTILCVIANVASGFCTSKIPFNICRALAGIGVAGSRKLPLRPSAGLC